MCDLEAKAAVQKIYDIKQMSPSKQLSILCRSLTDIGTYTLGFPVSQIGRTATFKLARQVLPGPVSSPAARFHCVQPPYWVLCHRDCPSGSMAKLPLHGCMIVW